MSSAVGSNNKPSPSVSQSVAGIGPDANLHTLSTDNNGVLNVNATLGAGAATAANQVLEIAQLTAINSNTSGSASEATLAAFSAKTASAAVHEAFDYQAITYVGATTDISTVVYKSGGAGGSTVATLTMGYDGSNRLTSVTKT